MFSRAITRRTRIRSDKELGGAAEAFLQPDRGLPAERLAGGGHVRPRVPDVTRARRRVVTDDLLAEEHSDRFGELVHARRGARGDVEDAAADADGVRRPERPVDDVV